jgi:hypothetical protein
VQNSFLHLLSKQKKRGECFATCLVFSYFNIILELF